MVCIAIGFTAFLNSYGQSTVTIRPQNTSYWTGRVDNFQKLDGEIKAGTGVSNYFEGWVVFDISSILSTCISITAITLTAYTNTASTDTSELVIKEMTIDPRTASLSSIQNDIGINSDYSGWSSAMNSIGYHTITLTATAESNLESKVQSGFSWWAVGFYEAGEDEGAGIIDGYNWGGTPEPSCVVTYTTTASTPPNSTSNSPQCGIVTITRSGTPPGGETWYWQGTLCGTSTSFGSGSTFTVTSSGTYYIRAYNSTGNCWSVGCGSVSVTVGAGGPPMATISGTSIASLDSILSYSASSSNATSYNWVVPNGWSILSGQGTPNITVSTNNNYQTICAASADVYVTPSNTCGSGTQQSFTVSMQHPKCLVTVDSTSTKNLIVWEKPVSSSIDSFYIYREITTNNYQKIGTTSYNELSEFTDNTPGVNPNTTSYKYKISFTDTCGNETVLSYFHKTIHLTIFKDVNNNPVLSWTDYVGFLVDKYRIMRDDFSTGNWQAMDSVSAGNTIYTDQNSPSDSSAYRIDAVPPNVCLATAKAKNYNISKSNYANKSVQGIQQPIENKYQLSIFPNPNTETTRITYTLTQPSKVKLEIYDLLGKKILKLADENQQQGKQIFEFSFTENEFDSGIYIVKLSINDKTIIKKLLNY